MKSDIANGRDNRVGTKSGDGAQAIRRAMEIARTVAQLQRSGATLQRVARATGLSTPTTHRILRALTDARLLRFDERPRCYSIGPLAIELGMAAPIDAPDHAAWMPIVSDVARRTRLTSYLMMRSGDEAVCVFHAQGSTAIRAIPMDVGQRVPLGIGAGSLAILASLDDGEVQRILATHEQRFAVFAGGPQSIDDIVRRVEQTRVRGFSISSGTVAAGVVGLGVLIPFELGKQRLAVTISAVADSLGEGEANAFAAVIRSAIASARARQVSDLTRWD